LPEQWRVLASITMIRLRMKLYDRRCQGGFMRDDTACPLARKTFELFVIFAALIVHGAIANAGGTDQAIRRDAPKGITTVFYTCVDKAGSDNVALGACLASEKSAQDARLNTAYKSLLGKLTPKAKDDLVHAEREWLKFKDANAEFENSIYGDESVANLQLTQNEIFRICDRANALETYLGVVAL
jgi:uncharacterized protein YecT (DUF1311 family)